MLPEMGLAFTWKPVGRLGRLGAPYGSRRVNGVREAPAGTGHMPRHTRPVSPLSNADVPSAGAVVAPSARPRVLRAANCYPPQNARMASCSPCTLENPKAAAAVSRPPNFVASAETLVP